MSYRMTEQMQFTLGYDEWGNNRSLIAACDKHQLSNVSRASGDVICKCGSPYRLHPGVQGALWATRTCEGIFKL